MKNIKSNSIMESFGMREIEVEELMQIDGGRIGCIIAISCGARCDCYGLNPCATKGGQCTAKAVF